MHEIKLAQNIVSILDREVGSPEVGEVKTVHLEVGALRYIVPEIMTSCFEHIPKNPKLDNAKIEIKVLPVKVKCSECGMEHEVTDGIYACSVCSSEKTEVVSGNEFMVKGIEW